MANGRSPGPVTPVTCQPAGTEKSMLKRFWRSGSRANPPRTSQPFSASTRSTLVVTASSASGRLNVADSE